MKHTCFYCGHYVLFPQEAVGITCCSKSHLMLCLVALRNRIDQELNKLDQEKK